MKYEQWCPAFKELMIEYGLIYLSQLRKGGKSIPTQKEIDFLLEINDEKALQLIDKIL